ncbi:ORF079 [Staphylococcus phage EW]|uniref:ORF079 n=1 Tax=Staphylococcus phage EW TaxID=2936814 RepID=Q4ZC32_9CAUD|nr:ORF079 [Staphylococcus phage EW]AAX91398.1 ORF079 [Staphylococcus phage EW]
MEKLYKITLLITMAVVTWKVIKIDSRLNFETLTNKINQLNADKSSFSLF